MHPNTYPELRAHRFTIFLRCIVTALALVALSHRAQAAAGDVYVGGPAGDTVSRVAPDGSVSVFAKGFNQQVPTVGSVRFDRNGNLYVLDTGYLPPDGVVWKVTPAGGKSPIISSPGSGWNPSSIAVDGNGNVYVANASQSTTALRKYTSTGTLIGTIATLPVSFVSEMACDSSGNVFAAGGSSVFRITPTGAITTLVTYSNSGVRGVAVDSQGNVFTIVTLDSTVVKIPAAGGLPQNMSNALPGATNLATDAPGNIYVSARTGTFNSGESFIYKLPPTGYNPTTIATVARTGSIDGFRSMAIEPPRGKPLNISTRARVASGDDALIGGFIVTGNAGKRVIIRAIGPSLGSAGVQGSLQDPVLELYNSSGTFVNGNDNWKSQNQAAIEATGVAPADDRESALLITLGSGSYTAVVRGKNNITGVALVEVYDLDQAADSQLANISTRGRIETAENVMIGGFIVGGNGVRGIVRAIGPSLAQVGVSGALGDPTLSLRDANGTEVARNNDWKTAQLAEIQATGVAPTNDRESALVRYFAPGNYTAIVSGFQGATGVGLVEFYNLQ